MVFDGVDSTIFLIVHGQDDDAYQSFDKALDVYYLTIAYISTIRHWTNPFAFKLGRLLWYYRLVGVALFTLTGVRWTLLIFANAFECLYLYYEGVRTRWNPARLSVWHTLGAVAAMLILIKLPQEYWLHIAQLDASALTRQWIFGVGADAGWPEALVARPWAVVIAAAVGVSLVLGVRRFVTPRLPKADWPLTLDAEADRTALAGVSQTRSLRALPWSLASVFEKIVLLSLVGVTLGSLLPGVPPLDLQIVVTLIIVLDAALGFWLDRVGTKSTSGVVRAVAFGGINFGLVLFYSALVPRLEGSFDLPAILALAFFCTVFIMLFDRHHEVREGRLQSQRQPHLAGTSGS